ncbi:MAG: DotU family type IV/VI secretion system protein [Candidatus Eisenbacteria bacterium]
MSTRPESSAIEAPRGEGPPSARSLPDCFAKLFSFAFGLRGAADLGQAEPLRLRLLEQLEQAAAAAVAAGFGAHDVEAARFPVVALLDEAILASTWPGRGTWMGNPLQRQLYNMNVAGEEFFIRLEGLRRKTDDHRPVLEVYFACLAMGFEGRFKLTGREKLEPLIRDLARELSHGHAAGMDNLSPAWKRPDDFPDSPGEGIPIWTTAVLVLGGMVLEVALFAVAARASAQGIAREIGTLITRVLGGS